VLEHGVLGRLRACNNVALKRLQVLKTVLRSVDNRKVSSPSLVIFRCRALERRRVVSQRI
jgi:hypothetical protein